MSKLDVGEFILSRKGNYSIHIVANSRFIVVINRDTNSVEECIRIEDSIRAHIDNPENIFMNISSNLKIDFSKIGRSTKICKSSFIDETRKQFFPKEAKLKNSKIITDNGHTIAIGSSDDYDMLNFYNYETPLDTLLGGIVERDRNGKPILGITLHANTNYLNQIACHGTDYGDDYEKFYVDFGIIAESKSSNDIHFIPTN